MMSTRARILPLVGAVVAAVLVTSDAAAAAVTPPPAHARFDYQIGGGYTPPSGVRVVSRDHGDDPAPGLYNICYVNAFQAQPGTESEWGDLLLRDAAGNIVYDEDWGEAFLDIRTAAKRQRIADKVNGWVDDCAAKGFQGVEPDNYDSFTRAPGNLLTAAQAQAHIRLLSAHAHQAGMAIAQKNTVELANNRVANGLDFAVAEECGYQEECDGYVQYFGNNVIVIEYDAEGLGRACEWSDRLSIVMRDVGVSTPDSSGYVYRTC